MADNFPEFGINPEQLLTQIDALIVLGIGGNIQRKGLHNRPVIENPRMRINAIATKELAVNGHIAQDTVIIPTGKGTEVVKWHEDRLTHKKGLLGQSTDADELRKLLPKNTSYLAFQDFMGQPSDEEELRKTALVSQGELMTDLIGKAKAKPSGNLDRGQISQDILPETRARTTILNLIEALNLLDAHVQGVWDGNIAILTTNTGHLQRAEECAHALGIKNALMLSSEQVLLDKGYNQGYIQQMLQMSEGDFKEQEKNFRAIKELPEFLIPEAVFIKNDQRLKQVVAHFETYYGVDALKKYGVEDHSELTADEIRERIGSVGINRTKAVLEACSEVELKELGIEGFDQEAQFEEIRAVLSSGVKPAEIARKVLIKKYGNDNNWLATNDLTDIATTEWYRIKNWFFGRKLPPNDWGDQVDVGLWRKQNLVYNQNTKTWLSETKPKS